MQELCAVVEKVYRSTSYGIAMIIDAYANTGLLINTKNCVYVTKMLFFIFKVRLSTKDFDNFEQFFGLLRICFLLLLDTF